MRVEQYHHPLSKRTPTLLKAVYTGITEDSPCLSLLEANPQNNLVLPFLTRPASTMRGLEPNRKFDNYGYNLPSSRPAWWDRSGRFIQGHWPENDYEYLCEGGFT